MRINFHKSVVCGVGVEEEILGSYADILNCKVNGLPLKFLGLPLGANLGRKSTWRPVLDTIKSRLTGWKRRLLSFAGRLTFSKSVLVDWVEEKATFLCREIERLEAVFLWGGNDLKRKVHLVKWTEVSKSLNQGGLGIRRLKDVNASLLLKWWWKFGSEVNALWRRMLCNKYMIEEFHWLPPINSPARFSRIWGDVLAVASLNQPLVEFFVEKYQIKVGNGSRIKFWYDKWVGSSCLKDEFPRLFCLSTVKDGTLSYFFERKSSYGEWNFCFRRPLYDWEQAEANRLVAVLLVTPSLCLNEVDCPVWNGSVGDKFKVWSDVMLWWGCLWVVPRNIDGLLHWWIGWNYKKLARRLWRALPCIILWSIWKFRNDCLFNGVLPCAFELGLYCVRSAVYLLSIVFCLAVLVFAISVGSSPIGSGYGAALYLACIIPPFC
ncbi:uncharacterized protein LOC114263352 [Camellia sinensis]|uniref:uncharacterized protein LOC114263352 n=1 Tax=Camellia sinensis TaxID=4442 RepID=UPI001036E660|nr:uncharacterized protein LOC114263352 [Camellia sinensis]